MDAAFENYSFLTNKQVYRKYNFYLKNHINNKLILLIIKIAMIISLGILNLTNKFVTTKIGR